MFNEYLFDENESEECYKAILEHLDDDECDSSIEPETSLTDDFKTPVDQ